MVCCLKTFKILPSGWPTYFKDAKININSLDNKNYKDFSIMGIGTAILGYLIVM